VISFGILGEVTARQDAWAASLSRQQQRLLAVLVMAKGAPVGVERLGEVLWDFRVPYPEGGVKRVAHEVRAELRRASPGGDPLPACDGGYRLPIAQEQADVLRFRATAAMARHDSGPAGLDLMRQALREWGPDEGGLHGGHPLRGLGGQWADGMRHILRTEYRDAVMHCLAEGVTRRDYRLVLRECEQRAVGDPEALRDEEFIALWMRAASEAGNPARAHQVYQRARDAASHAGERLDASLHLLDAHLRPGGSRPSAPMTPSPATAPAATDRRPVNGHDASEDRDGQAMTEQRMEALGSEEQPQCVRGAIQVDKLSGRAAAVSADLTGLTAMRVEGIARAGVVEAGGELYGILDRSGRG
jgi:DNA-binding SARP family transcriptional activator